ncbi:uncharacterized protein [Battus philenor]|uniref:uncharacterized protein n=1 Tax=Battus philenor TaxID=42288 RepID=UPI0035D0555B
MADYKFFLNPLNMELFNELPCLIMGGICIPAADCPDERRAQQPGLCPLQQRMNIECCHSLPSSEKRCHHRGGMCINPNWPCPENLTFKEARDCEDGQQCCILVQ